MNAFKSLILAGAGAVSGIVLIMSCSDDSPPDADAAPCECAAAEPPITESRIVLKSSPETVAPGAVAIEQEGCDEGGILLSGGCGLQGPTSSAPDLVMTQSFPYEITGNDGWTCEWKNNSTTITYDVQVTIRCLMPAQ